MNAYIEQRVDLTEPEANHIFNLTVEEARASLHTGDSHAVRQSGRQTAQGHWHALAHKLPVRLNAKAREVRQRVTFSLCLLGHAFRKNLNCPPP